MIHLLPRNLGAVVREAVLSEINRDPAVHPAEVGVAAGDGVVTLTGYVESRDEKVAIERAAKRVAGVRVIANELQVTGGTAPSDTHIAREALHALRNNRAVPVSVQAVVSNGAITLEGTVSSMHQRLAAEFAVKYIEGVKGVANDITVEVDAPAAVEGRVEGRTLWHV
jgi:osmotically-inducible protein OsmY